MRASRRLPARLLDVEANRHDQILKAASVSRLDQAWSQGADQLEQQVPLLHGLETVAEELGVEADLQWLSLEGDGHRLGRLADVGRLRRYGQLARREGQPEGSVLLG